MPQPRQHGAHALPNVGLIVHQQHTQRARVRGNAAPGGHGYHGSQSDLPVEFGLGSAVSAESVTVRWPSPGSPTTALSIVTANQRLVAYESGAAIRRGAAPDALPSYASASFFPWADPDPVLDPAAHPSYYYLVADDRADIRVDKDAASSSVRIRIRN